MTTWGNMRQLARKALKDLRSTVYPIDPAASLTGDGPYFLDWRAHSDSQNSVDARGVVVTRSSAGEWYENPVAMALHAVGQHTEFSVSGDESARSSFLVQAERLRETQDDRGGWIYPVAVPRYGVAPGWYSGMAQGLAASVFVRALDMTGETQFLVGTERAVALMLTPVDLGGCSDYDDQGRPFLEEVPGEPPSHVLNGAVFAYWGLVEANARLGGLPLSEATSRLLEMLPRFDCGYWSRYDLRYDVPASHAYHTLHISQLRVLSTITGDRRCLEMAERWERYRRWLPSRVRAAAMKAVFVGRRGGD